MSFTLYSFKLLLEAFKNILFFPIWWYSFGLIEILKKIRNFLSNREKGLALFVWIKNVFTPMYGQQDIQGRLISFFIRLVQIIFRGVAMIFWLVVAITGIAIWIILPFFILYQIVYQLM